jgi:hypothetical protein
MKNLLKKFALPLVLLLAISTSAFVTATKVDTIHCKYLFIFTGVPGSGDEFDPSQYVLANAVFGVAEDFDIEAICPGIDEVLCALCINDDNLVDQTTHQPKVNEDPLATLIANALAVPADDPANGIYLWAGN